MTMTPLRWWSPLSSPRTNPNSRCPQGAAIPILVAAAVVASFFLLLHYFLALGAVLETNPSMNGLPTTMLRDASKGRRITPTILKNNLHQFQPRQVTWKNWPVVDGGVAPFSVFSSWTTGTVQRPSEPIPRYDPHADDVGPDDILSQGPPPDTEALGTNTTTTTTTSTTTSTCAAADTWQDEAHPNCNSIHELILPTRAVFLGQGWFRMAWLYEDVVLKMLRLEREYLDEYYELHRRDAVAMDHLTFSPYVMNVYGYCGQSAINELANFNPDINALEQLDRRLRGQHSAAVLLLKLRLALAVSVGLYHVHYGIPGMPWEHGNQTLAAVRPRPSMAHYDINPRNIAIVKGGKPKLNDFNIAEFLRYPQEASTTTASSSSSTTCGFPARLHEPWWRAPEEMEMETNSTHITMVDEKVDIYALGAVLFHILTTHSPRGKMKKERMEEVRAEVVQGILPTLMEPFFSDPHPIVHAFREAMALCFHTNPRQRGTAGEVATILYRALEQLPGAQLNNALLEDSHPLAPQQSHHQHNEGGGDGKHKHKKRNNNNNAHDRQHAAHARG